MKDTLDIFKLCMNDELAREVVFKVIEKLEARIEKVKREDEDDTSKLL